MAVDAWAYGVLAAFVFMVVCGLAMEDGVRLSDLGLFLNTKEVIWIYNINIIYIYIYIIYT